MKESIFRKRLIINEIEEDQIKLQDLRFSSFDCIVILATCFISIAYLLILNFIKSKNFVELYENNLSLMILIIVAILVIMFMKMGGTSFLRLHYLLIMLKENYEKVAKSFTYLVTIKMFFFYRSEKIFKIIWFLLDEKKIKINILIGLGISIAFDMYANNSTLYYFFSGLQFLLIYFVFIRLYDFYTLNHSILNYGYDKYLTMLLYDQKLTLDKLLNNTSKGFIFYLAEDFSKEEHELWLETFKPFYSKAYLFVNLPEEAYPIESDISELAKKYEKPNFEELFLDVNLEKFLGLMEGPVGELVLAYLKKTEENKVEPDKELLAVCDKAALILNEFLKINK